MLLDAQQTVATLSVAVWTCRYLSHWQETTGRVNLGRWGVGAWRKLSTSSVNQHSSESPLAPCNMYAPSCTLKQNICSSAKLTSKVENADKAVVRILSLLSDRDFLSWEWYTSDISKMFLRPHYEWASPLLTTGHAPPNRIIHAIQSLN